MDKSPEKKVPEIIGEMFGVWTHRKDLKDRDFEFVGELELDGLALLELKMELEDEFGIEISEEAWENIHTIGQAIDCVKSLLPKPPPVIILP